MVAMYIERVPNRNSPPAILLREAWREDGKIRKRTIANLSDWPEPKIEAFRRLLRDEPIVSAEEAFTIESSLPHGHVEAILGTMRKLGLDALISSKRSRQRDLVLAMITERLLHPSSKLATTRLWPMTTLAQELSVGDADVDELYDAMDWLLERQPQIEKKLASRHLTDGAMVLYDVSSSYYEGRTCPLARLGHDRDGQKGLPIVVYGVMTDHQGRPLAIDVYAGNTGDPTTVADQVDKLTKRFKLSRVVLVGDRGMLTETQIEKLRQRPGLGWISALRSTAIRKLLEDRVLQRSFFDQKNLAEITSPDFPDERLMACFNPLLAEQRRRKRDDLLEATEKELRKIEQQVKRRTRKPLGKAEIAVKVGRVIHRFKMAKHFHWTIEDGVFTWTRSTESISKETELDGIYVIRTSEAHDRFSAEDTVRHYKSLSQVERGFRCFKGIDLRVRPIHHRVEDRVRAHLFLCMLAYYLEWHMRSALAPILFADEELDHDRKHRDPVAAAEPSSSAKKKKAARVTDDGLPVHSFDTLLQALATRSRHHCKMRSDKSGSTFSQLTKPTLLQSRAFELLRL
jgi:transposase